MIGLVSPRSALSCLLADTRKRRPSRSMVHQEASIFTTGSTNTTHRSSTISTLACVDICPASARAVQRFQGCMTMLSSEEQSRVREAEANIGNRAAIEIRARLSVSQAVAFIDTLHANVDKVVAMELSSGPPVHCKVGCAHCCSLRVEVTDPEALRIAAQLSTLAAVDLQALSGRLQENAQARKQQPGQIVECRPCAFLRNKLCTIYAVRPAACRKAHSLSLVACETFATEIPQNLALLVKCETLVAGTRAGYVANSLPASTIELSVGVLAALSSASAADDWHRGVPLVPVVPLVGHPDAGHRSMDADG